MRKNNRYKTKKIKYEDLIQWTFLLINGLINAIVCINLSKAYLFQYSKPSLKILSLQEKELIKKTTSEITYLNWMHFVVLLRDFIDCIDAIKSRNNELNIAINNFFNKTAFLKKTLNNDAYEELSFFIHNWSTLSFSKNHSNKILEKYQTEIENELNKDISEIKTIFFNLASIISNDNKTKKKFESLKEYKGTNIWNFINYVKENASFLNFEKITLC